VIDNNNNNHNFELCKLLSIQG